MFAASRFKAEISKHFDAVFKRRGFVSERDSSWESQMRGLGIRMRSPEFRLQAFWDRGSISMEVAPLVQTDAWFDSDWFNFNQLLSWLGHKDTDTNTRILANSLDVAYAAIAEFLSDRGLEARERYMQSVVGY